MVSLDEITALSEHIAREYRPERIVLLGSYAYGTPREDSDVDLLVVMPFEGRSVEKSAEIRRTVHAGFPLDLLAYPPEYVQQRITAEDFFLREIIEKGRVLYEASHR